MVCAHAWPDAPRIRSGTSAVGAAQAGPTFQFLVCGDPTVGQLIPTVSIETRVFWRRANAEGPVPWPCSLVVNCSSRPNLLGGHSSMHVQLIGPHDFCRVGQGSVTLMTRPFLDFVVGGSQHETSYKVGDTTAESGPTSVVAFQKLSIFLLSVC